MHPRALLAISFVSMLALSLASPAAAQRVQGLVVFNTNTDLNRERVSGIGIGGLVDLAHGWLSVGGQGDVFISRGYFGGRLVGLTQFNVVNRPNGRLFVLGGLGLGVIDGPMAGAGFELRSPRHRPALRVTVQDYIATVRGVNCPPAVPCGGRETIHQWSLQAGVTWRGIRR